MSGPPRGGQLLIVCFGGQAVEASGLEFRVFGVKIYLRFWGYEFRVSG